MKLRRLTWWLLVPALLLVTGPLAWWWLLHTESGAHWVFEKAAATSAASVGMARLSGDLDSGLQLDGLYFEDRSVRVSVETLTIAINIDLLPIAVDVETLHAGNVLIQVLQDSSEKPSGEKPAGSFALPFPVLFRDLKVSGIEYLDPKGESSFRVDSVEASGSVYENLDLKRFSAILAEDRLELSGRAGLDSPHSLNLEFQAQGRFTLVGSLRGDLNSAELVLDSTTPQVRISGTVAQLQNTPAWDLEMNSPAIRFPLDSPDPSIALTGMQARTTGEWPLFDLDLAAGLETRWLEPSSLVLSGSGSTIDFTAQKLTIQGPELSLDTTGTLSWEDTLHLGLAVNLDRLDPGKWLPDWPENNHVTGTLDLEWEGEDLSIDDFNLAVANTAFSAQGHGIVALQSGVIDMALSWNNFSWPLENPAPAIVSRSGSLQVSGLPEDWQLDGILDLQSGDFPPGQFILSGRGDDESLDITVREGKALGGIVSGNLSWNWTEDQPFTADISAQQINTTPLFADFPGVISTRLAVSGAVTPFHLKVTIHELNGTLMEYPVTGRGGFHIEQGRVFADGLRIGSGSSTMTLDGSLYEPGGIDFSTDIDSLARFSRDWRGSFSAEGNVSLDPAAPRISVLLSGRDLAIGSVEIEKMETLKTSKPGFDEWSEIILSGLTIGQRPIESMSIGFGGEQPLQNIVINALVEGSEIALALEGSVNDWAEPMVSGWSGEVSELRINHQDRFLLSLDQAAVLEWTPSRFLLEPMCLSGANDARLCAGSSWLAQDALRISADLASIPVSLVEMMVETELRFTQILSGTFQWSQTEENRSNGVARFEISPGTIRMLDDDQDLLNTGAGFFGFELAEGALKNGNLDLAFPGTGQVDIDFSVPDLSPGPESLVLGSVQVDFKDISAFGPMLPFLDSMSGALDIDLTLSGRLSDPSFNGSASLANGQVSNHASGFSFSEINIAGNVSDRDRSELKGTFHAGEGVGSITTTISFENMLTPVVELVLQGESLTIIDVPDLKVIANPDVVLTWRNNTLGINGRVFIPKARLSPTIIPQPSIRQSDDVVIVAGELPEPEENFLRDNPFNLRGTLEIELGKQAEVELEMAKVRVFGTTRFTWRDGLLPTANGNFDIRGDIQAYGQSLKVTQGRISFPDIPADNPHLNIRAERTIYGNTQIQKAGLMVAGTAKRPVIEAYTVPATNKDRAQTLLVTGSDFNYEQGVGAVAVGAYVLPKLYISYGIGVFEEGSVISARYDLGKRFGVKVTSGQKDTGVDLNYTIEN